jgi:hypothetical protein
VLSFPVAFALHDLEEVLAAGRWGRTAPERLRARFPRVPARVAASLAVTTPQVATAVGVVATGVAVTTALAWRGIDEDLGPLPAVLTAYTAHGGTHVLQSVVLREYTPGVLTVPLVIAPYSVWAWRTLRRAGLRRTPGQMSRDARLGGAAAIGLALVGHAVGRIVDTKVTPMLVRADPEALPRAHRGLRGAARPAGGRRATVAADAAETVCRVRSAMGLLSFR